VSRAGLAGALALAAALAAVLAAGVRAQTPEQTIDRAAAVSAKMQTARVSFTQTVTNPLTRKDVSSKGEMLQRLPGQYAVTFTDPTGDRIVSNGKVVWIYLPSTNPGQVVKVPIAEGGAGVPDFTSWLLDAPKERFALADGGKAVVGGRATHLVALAPRRSGAPFVSAKLWIDDEDGIVRQFETVDSNGSARRVRIVTIEMNVPVNAHAFTFTPPPGVKVFDQGTAAS
jgi:outer membrane lipoprotein carrier protein